MFLVLILRRKLSLKVEFRVVILCVHSGGVAPVAGVLTNSAAAAAAATPLPSTKLSSYNLFSFLNNHLNNNTSNN